MELYRLTVQTAVPPGREWLVDDFLPKLIHERAAEGLVIHGPVVLRSDTEAASHFAQVEREAAAPPRTHYTSVWRRFRRS